MNNYWMMYWLTRLDALSGLFEAVMIISCVILLGGIMLAVMVSGDLDLVRDNKKYVWMIVIALTIGAIGRTFVPTRNEAIVILAGGKTLNYAASDTSLGKIPYQTTKFISEYLDDKLQDLKKEK